MNFHPSRPALLDEPEAAVTTQATGASSTSKKKKTSHKKVAAHRTPSQMNPTPERVSDIQSALARSGYYKGDPSGKWDPDTVDALQKFQSANGLDTNGKLDALTLQKLGLGSDVAGVSAPKGIVSHSCCSMTASPSIAPAASLAPRPPTAGGADSPVSPAGQR